MIFYIYIQDMDCNATYVQVSNQVPAHIKKTAPLALTAVLVLSVKVNHFSTSEGFAADIEHYK